MPNKYTTPRNPLARFFTHVTFTNSCWLWTAYKDKQGYPRFGGPDGQPVLAYRWLYETLRCHLPRSLTLDHLCRVRHCVNIFDHLEPIPFRTNLMRGMSYRAGNDAEIYCKRGHPWSEENTRIRPNGTKSCRRCDRIYPSRHKNRRSL